MALPDIATQDWQKDQADLFRQLTNAKIGAAQFQQTTGQQIADATRRIAALATQVPATPAMPSSLEGPSSRASQASQPLDTTSGIAPSALTMPVQAFSGGGPSVDTSQASGSRGGSFGDFASGLIDQARQRVAALTSAPPGGPADVTQENAPPSWLPGRQAAGVTESPEDTLRSRVATVPNVPEAAGQVGQTALAYANQQSAQNAAAFPDKPMRQYTPAEQEGAIQGAGKAALGVLGGDLPGAGEVGKVAGEAAAPIAAKIGDVAQGAVDRFYHGTGTTEIGAYPLAGDVVSGMKVHAETPNLSSIGATLGEDAYTVLRGVREVPMRYFEQPPALTPRNKELARQIAESGTIKPLIVGIDQEGPYILEGAHRYDALKINGAQSFPAVVVAESGARPVPPDAGPPATPPSVPPLGGGGGTTMGSPPAIGGAVLGGVLGASQGDTPQERAKNAAIGAAAGGGLGFAAGRLGPRVAPLIHTPAWLNEILAPARNAPQDVQNALRTFANARLAGQVDAETLGMRAQRILGSADTSQAASNFERTGQFTPRPTPEQQGFGSEIQRFMRDTGLQGRANKYIAGDVTMGAPGAPAHYFPHIYQDNLNAARIAAGKGGLNPRDFYSNARVYPTLQDAIAAGKQPLDSVSEPLRHYAARIGDSEAKVALVSDLRNASPSAVMDLAPGQQAPTGWTPGGAVAPQFHGVAFPSATADAIKNILNPSAFRNFAAVRGAQSALAEAKGTLFSLSGFHLLTELRQAYRANGVQGVPVIGRTLWNAMVPGAYGNFRLANADLFSAAARAGVTGLSEAGRTIPDVEPGLAGRLARPLVRAVTGGVGAGASAYTSSKAAGEDEQTARDKALLFGAAGAIAGPTLGPVINQALWQRAVPTLKALTFGIARQSGRDPQAAATFVNQTFGGNNLAAIARSPTFQDALRLTTMAPDWWEGWARQLGGIVNTQALGGMSRAYWLRTALVDGAFGLEGLNYALNGHFTDQNDPEHRFDLELTGLYDRQGLPHADPKTGMPARVYADILGPIRSMLNTTQGTAGVGGFVRGRLSVPMGVGVSALSNQDYRGRPIVPPFTPLPEAALKEGINAVGSVAPIGAQSLDQAGKVQAPPVLAGAAAVLGTRLSQGGQSTETAPGLSAASRAILDRNGLTYNPSQVGASIDNVPLTRAERTLYQERANQYRDQAIARLASEPGFARGTALQRQRALTADLRAADSKAADDVARQIGGTEAKRRLGLAPAGKP